VAQHNAAAIIAERARRLGLITTAGPDEQLAREALQQARGNEPVLQYLTTGLDPAEVENLSRTPPRSTPEPQLTRPTPPPFTLPTPLPTTTPSATAGELPPEAPGFMGQLELAGLGAETLGRTVRGLVGGDHPAAPRGTSPSETRQFSKYDDLFRQYMPDDLKNDSEFLHVVTTAALAESGLDPTRVGDGGASIGLFQHHEKGRGAKLIRDGQDLRTDPEAVAAEIIPDFARVYREVKARGVTGAQLASEVARRVEQPKDWENPNGAAAQNYLRAYRSLETPGGGARPPDTTVTTGFKLADYVEGAELSERGVIEMIQQVLDDPMAGPTDRLAALNAYGTFMARKAQGLSEAAAAQRALQQMVIDRERLTLDKERFGLEGEKFGFEKEEAGLLRGERETGRQDRLAAARDEIRAGFMKSLQGSAGGFAAPGTDFAPAWGPGGPWESVFQRAGLPFSPIAAPQLPSPGQLSPLAPETLPPFGGI